MVFASGLGCGQVVAAIAVGLGAGALALGLWWYAVQPIVRALRISREVPRDQYDEWGYRVYRCPASPRPLRYYRPQYSSYRVWDLNEPTIRHGRAGAFL